MLSILDQIKNFAEHAWGIASQV